jgi:hypothetical protein
MSVPDGGLCPMCGWDTSACCCGYIKGLYQSSPVELQCSKCNSSFSMKLTGDKVFDYYCPACDTKAVLRKEEK